VEEGGEGAVIVVENESITKHGPLHCTANTFEGNEQNILIILGSPVNDCNLKQLNN